MAQEPTGTQWNHGPPTIMHSGFCLQNRLCFYYLDFLSTYIIFSQLYIIFTANKYYRLFHYNLAIHACLGFRLIFATKYFSRKNFDYIFDVDLSLLECIYSFEYPHPLVSQSEIVPTTVQIYYQAINIVRKYNFIVSNFSLHFIIYFRQRRWL